MNISTLRPLVCRYYLSILSTMRNYRPVNTHVSTAGQDVVEKMLRIDEVPEDICVAGFNNSPFPRVIDPNLTTVHYPGQEMGEVAASTLINILDNSNSAMLQTIVLKHELIIRFSSSRINL